MQTGEIIETLNKCELFRHLDDGELNTLAGLCTLEQNRAGETIYNQGEIGNRLYILSSGQVTLHRSYLLHGSRSADVAVFVLRETDSRRLFGGWCALVGKDHSFMCSARCDRDSKLVVIDGASIRSFVVGKVDIRVKILEMLVVLLRGRLESSYDTFESI